MFYNIPQFLMPLICFSMNVLSQLCSRRFFTLGLLKSEFVGFIVGFLCIFIIESYINFTMHIPMRDSIAIGLTDFIIYISLVYCYFHFINLAITARRIRLLKELYCSQDGLTMNEILTQYNAKNMIDNRINRLLGSKQILLRDGRYFIGRPIMQTISKIIIAMKQMILGKKSEFD